MIYISSGKDTESWIICLRLLHCTTGTAKEPEHCGQSGHTEIMYPGEKKVRLLLQSSHKSEPKHMWGVLTYTSCGGQDLWGSELVSWADQARRNHRSPAWMLYAHGGKQGCAAKQIQSDSSGTEIHWASRASRERGKGRGAMEKWRSDFTVGRVSRYGSTGSSEAEATCQHKHQFTSF